ncbi:MAG: alpha/beta hydrolase [Phycisphaerae bacterium]
MTPALIRRAALAPLLAAPLLAAALLGCRSADDLLPLRLAGAAIVNAGASVGITSGIVYAQRDTGSLDLDLYRPLAAATARPLVIVVHGGSWDSGSPADVAEFAFDLAANGFVAAAIRYRLVDAGGTFPHPVADLLEALTFLRAHAADYGIDDHSIGLLGVSAGSTLTLLAGLASDVSVFDPALPAGPAPGVRAIVNIAGPTDFTIDESSALPWQISTVEAFLGVPLADAGSLREQASPVHYVRADGPAVLTIHGTLDALVPIDQAHRLDAALDSAGQAHQLCEIPGMEHFGAAIWYSPFAQLYRGELLGFLADNL